MILAPFDIETIPNQGIPEGCIPKFDPNEVKLGNTKDPVKIQQKIAEERTKFRQGLDKKMSVDPAMAQVCTFAGVIYDTDADKVKSKSVFQVTEDADDYEAIHGAWSFIRSAYNQRIPLVSFNGIKFDLPILWHRAIIMDVPISTAMYDRITPRWGNRYHYDLMQIMAGWDKSRWHSLDFYLRLFRLGGKSNGMDGSMVYATWLEGDFDKIQKYCENDVIKTAELFGRVESWLDIPNNDDPEDETPEKESAGEDVSLPWEESEAA